MPRLQLKLMLELIGVHAKVSEIECHPEPLYEYLNGEVESPAGASTAMISSTALEPMQHSP